MEPYKKVQLIGDYAEEKSKAAYAASLYLIFLNFVVIGLAVKFEGFRDFFKMILTPVFALTGGEVTTYFLLVIVDVAAILILQQKGKSEAHKAHFFKE